MAPGKPQSHNGQGRVGYRQSAQGAPDSVRREWCVGSSILAAQACISRFRRLPLPSQKQGANTASAKTLVPRRERRSAFAPGSWALAEQLAFPLALPFGTAPAGFRSTAISHRRSSASPLATSSMRCKARQGEGLRLLRTGALEHTLCHPLGNPDLALRR